MNITPSELRRQSRRLVALTHQRDVLLVAAEEYLRETDSPARDLRMIHVRRAALRDVVKLLREWTI